jgi:putative ABC transport system permease protein
MATMARRRVTATTMTGTGMRRRTPPPTIMGAITRMLLERTAMGTIAAAAMAHADAMILLPTATARMADAGARAALDALSKKHFLLFGDCARAAIGRASGQPGHQRARHGRRSALPRFSQPACVCAPCIPMPPRRLRDNTRSTQVLRPVAAGRCFFEGACTMTFYSLMGALEIGLIFGLVALGVLISFRVLNFPDLSVDGTFPLGGAVAATMIAAGANPFAATAAATAAGAAAGLVTGLLNVRFKIMDLLAGILVMTALYSVNLRIMGKPNVPLILEPTFFSALMPAWMPDYIEKPLLLLAVCAIVKFMLDWFFNCERGLAMRATGANPRMARAQGVCTGWATLAGLALSNALVAFAGALFAQSQGGADISMGIGTIVIGLAAVIIGENVLPSRRIVWATMAVIAGAVLYRFFIALALNSNWIGLKSQDLNMITAALVVLALIVPTLKRRLTPTR